MTIYLFSDDYYFSVGLKQAAQASSQPVVVRRWADWGLQFILQDLSADDLLLLDASSKEFIRRSLCFPFYQKMAKICILKAPGKALLPVFSRWHSISKNISARAVPGLLVLLQSKISPSFYCPGRLTARESQVVDRLCGRHSSHQIARDLNISIKTLSAHKINVMKKMGVMNFYELSG